MRALDPADIGTGSIRSKQLRAATARRRSGIVDRLSRQSFIDLAELQEEYGCSFATLRRDLAYLNEQGLIRRTYGGAVAAESGAEEPFASRVAEMAEAKRRIGVAAGGLISEGQAVGLTGGTTTQQVARALAPLQGLTILTNAVTVALEFTGSLSRVIVSGGEMRSDTCELVGPLAEHVLTEIHIDTVFVGADGLSVEGGLTTHSPMEARINRVLMDQAARVVVVVDHTKLGQRTLARVAPISLVHMIITDADAPFELTEPFEAHGILIIRA
jgi:DeoR family transcriptional regulator, aga operon transcriptional repressor